MLRLGYILLVLIIFSLVTINYVQVSAEEPLHATAKLLIYVVQYYVPTNKYVTTYSHVLLVPVNSTMLFILLPLSFQTDGTYIGNAVPIVYEIQNNTLLIPYGFIPRPSADIESSPREYYLLEDIFWSLWTLPLPPAFLDSIASGKGFKVAFYGGHGNPGGINTIVKVFDVPLTGSNYTINVQRSGEKYLVSVEYKSSIWKGAEKVIVTAVYRSDGFLESVKQEIIYNGQRILWSYSTLFIEDDLKALPVQTPVTTTQNTIRSATASSMQTGSEMQETRSTMTTPVQKTTTAQPLTSQQTTSPNIRSVKQTTETISGNELSFNTLTLTTIIVIMAATIITVLLLKRRT